MAFDSDTRNMLARTVAQARQLLTDEFIQQLQEIYGIQPDGAIVDVEKLTHLDDEEAGTAKFLRERISHLVSGVTTEKKPVVAAIDRVVREQAFTILNRFAALRMCEERSLVEECVRAGMQSKSFKVYENIAGSGLGDIYERYKTFLFCLFDEIAVDLGVLFDRFSPQGLLFPREQALLELLTIINNDDLSKLWAEDETIGWVYQYFNPPEERKAMREASQAPRNSRELAVRNQFFTPRYVVEFLTDNTLGRLWYEIRRGDTALKEECRFLVRRPNEVFLAPGEKASDEPKNETGLSQKELLKKTVHIEHRPKKDPRDLRVLDPACGSGHFLLYALDLLDRIYEEAWEDPGSPKSVITGGTLREDFETLDDLRRAVPKLIITHNLHGIDIDPRAVQIAALALWLRAQKTWKNFGIKTAERPRVVKSNIVTAEPMPGEEDMRREFTAGLKPRVLGQLVDLVFDKMKLAGEAGSLLKIEEEIKDAVADARKQWLEGPKPEQQLLFPGIADPRPKQQELRFDFKGVTEERFWEQAEDHILEALKDYAERAENGHAIRRRLFAKDAAHGFAFIALCRKRYDVVLMNPPFGEACETARPLLEQAYIDWNKNLLCAFFERAQNMAQKGGAVGAIIDKTALVKSSYEKFRVGVLDICSGGHLFVDTGWGVLEANVETACIVRYDIPREVHILCRLSQVPVDERSDYLVDLTRAIADGKLGPGSFYLEPRTLELFPNRAIPFEVDDWLIPVLSRCKRFEAVIGRALAGHSLKSDINFRLSWERPPGSSIGVRKYWSALYNGGDYSRYAIASRDITRYGESGSAVPPHVSTRWCNLRDQQKPGIAWGKRGDLIDTHVMSEGSVFTVEGQGLPLPMGKIRWIALGLMNSPLFSFLLNLYCGQHKYAGYVNACPVPDLEPRTCDQIAERTAEAHDLVRSSFEDDETALEFCGMPNLGRMSLRDMAQDGLSKKDASRELLRRAEQEIWDACFDWYRVPSDAQATIKLMFQRSLDEKSWFWLPNGLEEIQVSTCEAALSLLVGFSLGLWDVRLALNPSLALDLPDPFDQLPVCPRGMLVGPDGLPAEPGRIVSEEWLRARPDTNTLPSEGMVKNPTILDLDYPLRISWEGILVDDPGFSGAQPHRDDILRRAREVLDLLWKDKSHNIEQEACDILDVFNLQDYFRKPSGFFQDHLKRYSKGRRKAPIYWPLSTKSGSYNLWIYYHRLTDQTLYACVNDYANLKLSNISKDIVRLQEEVAKQGSTKNRQKLEQLMDFERELKDFRDELLRVAGLPYRPNLNDGVMITAAPLWKLFRHNQWRKDLEVCWKKLKDGEYDWAHLAYAIWPDRVKKNCRTDLSVAIAHDLEDLYEGDDTKPKRRKEMVES